MLLKRSAHHSTEQLRYVSVVHCPAEGHHGFCPGAVPAGGKRFFEENDFDPPIVSYARGFTVGNIQAADLNCGCSFAKGVDNLALKETVAKPFFDDSQAIVQVRRRNLMRCAILNLNH